MDDLWGGGLLPGPPPTQCLQKRLRVKRRGGAHLPVAALGPHVHLAEVFGEVIVEGRLTVAEADHPAVVGVFHPVVTEELPAHDVSAARQEVTQEVISYHNVKHTHTHSVSVRDSLSLAGDVVVLGRPSAEGVVGPPGVLLEAPPTGLHRT